MFATLADLKLRLGITVATYDALLTAVLTAASAAVRRFLNYDPAAFAGTEFLSGYGTRVLYLGRPDVTAVTRVSIARDGFLGGGYDPAFFTAAGDLAAGTDYALVGDALERLNGRTWPAAWWRRPESLAPEPGSGQGNILVTYTAGNDPDLLAVCAQATLLEAAAIWLGRYGTGLVQGASVDGVSVTLGQYVGRPKGLPLGLANPLAAQMLGPFRRIAIGSR